MEALQKIETSKMLLLWEENPVNHVQVLPEMINVTFALISLVKTNHTTTLTFEGGGYLFGKENQQYLNQHSDYLNTLKSQAFFFFI